MLSGDRLRVRMARDRCAEIEAVVSAAAGRAVTVELIETEEPAGDRDRPSGPAAGPSIDRNERNEQGEQGEQGERGRDDRTRTPPPTPDEEAQHPLVRLAAEQFGARVTGVHPKRPDRPR